MRAKIMLLYGSAQEEMLCSLSEEILTEVSAAFHHSFSLMRESISASSREDDPEILTDKTIEACQQCQAILLCTGSQKCAQELYDALNLPLRIRSFCIPHALCSRHESPVSFWLAQALSVDSDTVRIAMEYAFRFARESDAKVTHVAPAGASKAEWDGAVRVQEVNHPYLSSSSLSAPDAIRAIITAPNHLGVMICPPYAGSILNEAAAALCPHPFMMHDTAFDDTIGVYSPVLPLDEQEIRPFSCALSIAHMMRFSLGLAREAACIEAAVNNVLSAHPQIDGIDIQGLVALICEQIAVAGELMERVGIS